MGDIETLLEKAKDAVSEEKAEDLGKRFLKGEFNLLDLYEQMEAMKKMGSLGKLMEMIPGMGQLKIPKEALETQEANLKKWRHCMDSMTKEELEDPDIITSARIDRISKGSGVDVPTIRLLLKQYAQAKKLGKMLKGRDMGKVMKQLGGIDPRKMMG